MSDTRVHAQVRGDVGRLTLTRPEGANAIDLAFAREFEAAVDTFARERVRAVLISAEGRHFCAGGDVKAFSLEADLPTHLTEVTSHLHAGLATLVELDAPVVCAVQGSAAGAGLGLVGAADIVLAASAAKFVMAYTSIGLSPDGSSSWFLPRHVGLRRALDLTLTNRVLSAPEALEWGLVSRVVPDDALGDEAEALVATLAAGPTAAYGASARLLRASASAPLREHLAAEAASIAQRAGSRDGVEGIRAFLDKRPAAFTGE